MGLNSFSDLSDDEFSAIYLSQIEEETSNFECSGSQASTTNLPDSIDWVAKGINILNFRSNQ
jgi:hypothetical protein